MNKKLGVFNLSIPYLIIFLLVLFLSFAFTGSYTGFFAYNETNITEDFLNESSQEILLNNSMYTPPVIEDNATNISDNEIKKELEVKEVKLNEKLKDDQGNEIAKKIEDDSKFETYFTYTDKTDSRLELSFYHDSDETQKIWIEGNVNYQLNKEETAANDIVNLSVDLVDGKIPRFKLHIGDESEVFEFGITIINVHSRPAKYGNWTVMFNTTGVADLRIIATIDTNYTAETTKWANYSEDESLYDLKFLEIKCGSKILNYEWQGTNCNENECSVLVPDYSCDETAYEISKVIKSGKHVLRFDFGDDSEYAYNDANNIPIVSGVYLNSTTNGTCGAIYSNLTVNFTVSDADGNNTKNITTWYLDNHSIMELYLPFEGGSNATYTMDYSGFNNKINISSPDYLPTGGYDKFGAYNFTGNDYIITNSLSALNSSNFTFGAWFIETSSANPSSYVILSQMENIEGNNEGNEMLVYFNGSDDVLLCYNAGTGDDTSASGYHANAKIEVGKWYHGMCIQNDTFLCAYKNGEQAGCVELGDIPGLYPNYGNFSIGRNLLYNYYFNGTIDDVIVFNRTLSDEQIKFIFENKTNILSSFETNTGDIWQINITVNDGVEDSAPVESNYLEIVNSCVTDTCTYSSGDWNIDCSDNCQIISNVNLGGNNIYFTNAGEFYVKANIENYGLISLSDDCNIVMYDNGMLGGA